MSAEISASRENPFSISTNPRLTYFDMPRRNAVARLLTGLYQGDGLFLLVGEDGIGKTTLLRHLGIQVGALAGVRLLHSPPFVSCSEHSGFADIVDGCAEAFGTAGVDPLQIARFLQDIASESEQMPAILIDDADRLDEAALRAIATLTTLRGGERRLLSAVLAGTTELPSRLQKVSGTADSLPPDRVIQLSAMSRAEVEKMIRHRLRQAGRSDLEEALQPAIGELAGQCNGVPQQVLGLCRRALHTSENAGLRLSLSAAMPAPAAATRAEICDATSASASNAIAAGSTVASAIGGVKAAPGTDVASRAAADAAAEARLGSESAPPTAAPAVRDAAAEPSAEFPGHIRYTAASARRVEFARWQNARRRRRPGRRAAVAVGSMLMILAIGWSVYDHMPRRKVDAGPVRTAVVDPLSKSALAPSLVPSPPMSPSPLVSPSDPAPIAPSALPSPPISGVPPTELWWRPSSMAEAPGADAQPGRPSGIASVPSDLPPVTGRRGCKACKPRLAAPGSGGSAPGFCGMAGRRADYTVCTVSVFHTATQAGAAAGDATAGCRDRRACKARPG